MEDTPKRGRVLRVSYLKRVFAEEEDDSEKVSVAIDSVQSVRKHGRKRSSADSGCGFPSHLDTERSSGWNGRAVASSPVIARSSSTSSSSGGADRVAVPGRDGGGGEVPVRTRRAVPKYAEATCLCSVMLIIAALFTLPAIFYHLQGSDEPTTSSAFGNLSQNASGCSLSYGVVSQPGGCSAQPYSGGVCSQQLLSWQRCIAGQASSGEPRVTSSVNQAEAEDIANTVIPFIYDFGSSECIAVAEMVMCYYLFPLCDPDSGVVYHATKQDCVVVRDQVCSNLWSLAAKLYPDEVPDCNALPDEVGYDESVTVATQTPTMLANITCSDDFYNLNGACEPLCGQWEQYPHPTAVAVTTVETITSAVGLVLGVISVLLSAFLFWERILRYYFFILTTAGYCVLATLLIISSTDRKSLFCDSDSLTNSLTMPTAFCTAAGALTHFSVASISLTWFLHVLLLSWRTIFPVNYNRTHRSKLKRISLYLTLTLMVYLIPIPLVMASLLEEDFQYATISFPPSLCIPSNINYWYYSTALPLNILVAGGCCLSFLSLWFMVKQCLLPGGCSFALVNSSDIKLLIVSFPYVLFGIMVQLFTIGAADDSLTTALLAYFLCEQPGTETCPRDFEQYTHPDMFVALYVVVAVTIPLTHFVLVLVSWREIKTTLANQCVTQSPLPNSPSVTNSLQHPLPNVTGSTPGKALPAADDNQPGGPLHDHFLSNLKPDYHDLIIQDKPPSPLSLKTQTSYAYSDVLF